MQAAWPFVGSDYVGRAPDRGRDTRLATHSYWEVQMKLAQHWGLSEFVQRVIGCQHGKASEVMSDPAAVVVALADQLDSSRFAHDLASPGSRTTNTPSARG